MGPNDRPTFIVENDQGEGYKEPLESDIFEDVKKMMEFEEQEQKEIATWRKRTIFNKGKIH